MQIHELLSQSSKTTKKRVGRGGGRGKTSGRGHKGQKARAGGTPRPAFRDIIKKIPKLRGHGINRARTINPNKKQTVAIPIEKLDKYFDNNETVSKITLIEKGLLSQKDSSCPIKIIGNTAIKKKIST